jgi:hypothetical protein
MALQRMPARMAFGHLKQTVPNSAAVPADKTKTAFAAEYLLTLDDRLELPIKTNNIRLDANRGVLWCV